MLWILSLVGLISGLLAGLLGIGGGALLVPALIALGYPPVQSVATSTLTILISSLAGSFQNWRLGFLDWRAIIPLAIPSLFTAQLGVYGAQLLPQPLLVGAFGALLIVNLFLTNLKNKLSQQPQESVSPPAQPLLARLITGGSAGVLAGLFGVGGE